MTDNTVPPAQGQQSEEIPNATAIVPPSDQTSNLDRIAFKAPDFWQSDPDLWFDQVESHFSMSGIKRDLTKFHAVVTALDLKVLKCVRDLVRKPPSTNAYATLKKRILESFEQSESSKLNLLLNELELGDQRPSQLLCEMQNLNGGKLNEESLRALWIKRLPNNVQQILSVCSEEEIGLSKLAKIADRIIEGSHGTISAVEPQPRSLDALHAEIAALKNAFENLIPQIQKPRSRFRSRTNSRGSNSSKSKPFCWYHYRFGHKANKCTKPCDWQENNQARLPRRQ